MCKNHTADWIPVNSDKQEGPRHTSHLCPRWSVLVFTFAVCCGAKHFHTFVNFGKKNKKNKAKNPIRYKFSWLYKLTNKLQITLMSSYRLSTTTVTNFQSPCPTNIISFGLASAAPNTHLHQHDMGWCHTRPCNNVNISARGDRWCERGVK